MPWKRGSKSTQKSEPHEPRPIDPFTSSAHLGDPLSEGVIFSPTYLRLIMALYLTFFAKYATMKAVGIGWETDL